MQNLNGLKAVVEHGPPPEPTFQNPGPILQLYQNILAKWHEDHVDQSLTNEDTVMLLAYAIDKMEWGNYMQQFNQMKQVVERSEQRIQVVR